MSDTIAAIATAAGNGGIGIVRISGDEAFNVVDRLYRSASGSFHIADAADHTVHYGFIYDDNEPVDEVLVTVFFSPRSFTGENVAEISCHGGYFVTKKILSLVIREGARLADPGEFTKRAYLNGRINLSQAEAVIDIINARNDFALKNSLLHLSGSVKKGIEKIRDRIIKETAYIEAALDDPEHYSLTDHTGEVIIFCDELLSDIDRIISSSANASLLKNGIRTLIIGKPNAGKSSLLNILAGSERAIVTDIAGTTRDTIEEIVDLDGIILNLIDTAGIRQSGDIVERIGIDRAISMIDTADLILYVMDLSVKADEDDIRIACEIKGKNVIVLLNKTDIAIDEPEGYDLSFVKDISENYLWISAKTGSGIDDLREMIIKLFMLGELSFDEELYITSERQLSLMKKARTSIENVRQSAIDGMTEDFFTIDLMDAYAFLGEITGEQVSDDLADTIFEKFCMGK